jgi:MFS family permease
MVPWSIKPLYGMWADTVAVLGFYRTPVIIFGGLLGSVCLFLLAVSGMVAAVAVVFMFGVNLSVSSPDVMIDASVAEKVVEHPRFGSDLQSLCWGSMALCSVVGFGTSGFIIQAGGPQTIFGVLIIFGLVVFVVGIMGWFGEEKETREPTLRRCRVFEWHAEQYHAHKYVYALLVVLLVYY